MSRVAEGTAVIEIELQRIEMRMPKPKTPVKQHIKGRAEDAVPVGHQNGSAGLNLESPDVD